MVSFILFRHSIFKVFIDSPTNESVMSDEIINLVSMKSSSETAVCSKTTKTMPSNINETTLSVTKLLMLNCLCFVGLSLSSEITSMLVTTSTDETVKVWDIANDKPSLVHSRNLKIVSYFQPSMNI